MPGSASVTAPRRCHDPRLAGIVGAAELAAGAWGNLAGPRGFGPPLTLVAGFGGGVQQFGHRAPGAAVAGGAGFAAEPAPQLHLDLRAMALGNPVEEGVLIARRQVLDPSGQLAGIVFRLGQG